MLFISHFDIVQWLVKWFPQAGSKRKDAIFLDKKSIGNWNKPFSHFFTNRERTGWGWNGQLSLPRESSLSSSFGTGQYSSYFRIKLITCLPQWMQYWRTNLQPPIKASSISYGLALTNTVFVMSWIVPPTTERCHSIPWQHWITVLYGHSLTPQF